MLLTQHTHLEGAAVLSLLQVWKLRRRGGGGELRWGRWYATLPPLTRTNICPLPPRSVGASAAALTVTGKRSLFVHIFFFYCLKLVLFPSQLPVPPYITAPGGGGHSLAWRGAPVPGGPGRYLGMSLWGCSWHRVGVGDRNAAQCPALPRTGPYRMTRPHFHSAEGERPCVSYLEKN